jgi:outer membrane lipoprotein-sorting protein
MRARWLTAVLLVISIRTADAANIGSNELFQRMEKLNADVKTYTASLHVDVAMKSFPYLSPTLDGNVYYEQPDRTAVVFNTVPVLAEQFKKVYPNIEPPSKWLELYDVSVVGDTNGTTWFKLVPKNAARVDHVDVRADDKTATIVAMTWTYKDGGYVTLAQQFGTFAGHLLVNRQTGHIELPGYKADVSAAFSGYKLNVPIDERVFGS